MGRTSTPASGDASGDGELTRVRHERVGEGEDGQRIDNFLLRRAPGVPRSHLYRVIRTGDVRVDGRRVKPTRKLRTGEQVRVPPMRIERKGPVRVPDAVADALGAAVVFEHDDFLVIDKPPGIAVHGGSGLAFGLIDALRQARAEPTLELVHRLDRGTSGALLVARGTGRCRALQQLFRERGVDKRYVALADGAWPERTTTVTLALRANSEHAGERRVMVDPDGQSAISHFAVRRRFGQTASELAIRLETGRTHQIRVHALASGCALIGDQRYGDNRRNTLFRRAGLARLCLHAERLGFRWQSRAWAIDVPGGDRWTDMYRALDRLASGTAPS